MSTQVSFKPLRFYLILILITCIVIGLIFRVFDLAILDQSFLRHQGNERMLRLVNTQAFRGMIVDRHHFPLAVSAKVYSLWINPSETSLTQQEMTSLSMLLKINRKQLNSTIERYRKTKREFIYLKRGLPPEIAQQIKLLNLPGFYLQQEYHRYYSEGENTAHIIGFTNIDDQGQEGLELVYNDWLQGTPGLALMIKDRLGRVISEVKQVRDQKPGRDLVLSIDRRIQYLAYRELLDGVSHYQARSGSAIVLDVKTGEVLAIVNQPSFNPNNRSHYPRDHYRNRAITDTFEPGSTIKAFSIASAFDSGHYKADTVIDTYPGWMRVGHNIVKDEHNNGPLTVAQILQKSSNVGVTKMILNLPPNQLWSLLHRVGFGEITGVGFPGEQSGSLVKRERWGDFVLATLSWGYGISVNALQLARAYAVIASGGMKRPVSLLRLNQAPSGERVMEASVAEQMLALLESVVADKKGTGKRARIPGYRVAGKTGTTVMSGIGGYQKHRYIASFVGIAPLSDPRIVVAVIIHDPKGKEYYGGDVSAPVFQKIMEGSLRILNIPPDAA